jgi:hypothetical protein
LTDIEESTPGIQAGAFSRPPMGSFSWPLTQRPWNRLQPIRPGCKRTGNLARYLSPGRVIVTRNSAQLVRHRRLVAGVFHPCFRWWRCVLGSGLRDLTFVACSCIPFRCSLLSQVRGVLPFFTQSTELQVGRAQRMDLQLQYSLNPHVRGSFVLLGRALRLPTLVATSSFVDLVSKVEAVHWGCPLEIQLCLWVQ